MREFDKQMEMVLYHSDEMEEFEKSVNAFLEFRQYKILKDNGRISHKQAMDKANAEYEIFNRTQPIESDFDKAVKKMIEEQK